MVKAPHASMFGLHLSAVGSREPQKVSNRRREMVAILKADWDEQTRVWETSQKVTAGIQKKNNKIVVHFLHKKFKFSLLLFFASLF